MRSGPDTNPLIDALRLFDDDSRHSRAARIEWTSSLFSNPGVITGEIVPMALIDEARVCFINGQFFATVLCAASAIEHLLVAELEENESLARRLTLGQLIEAANPLLDEPLISRLVQLNDLRNPIAHRRSHENPTSFANRYLAQKVHPDVIKEGDARFSLEVMYEVLGSVLKPGT